MSEDTSNARGFNSFDLSPTTRRGIAGMGYSDPTPVQSATIAKVLLVQAYPNFEYRYLKNMLERDSTIILRTVLQEADLEYASEDPSALSVFPVRRDKLSEDDDGALFYYDCIVFGDVNPAFLSTVVMNNLADFVQEQGRGIVFMAGQRFTPTAARMRPPRRNCTQ